MNSTKNTKARQALTPGDIVTFNTEKINLFEKETNGGSLAMQKYGQVILACVNQIATVQKSRGNMITVSFPDGRSLPVPAKYFTLLPSVEDL